MTDSESEAMPAAVRRAFERHDAFERVDGDTFEHVDGDEFALESTAFDVAVTAAPAPAEGRAGVFSVSLSVPTLSASVADPSDVAPVVEDGWFETFERRLEDAFDVAKTSDGEPPVLERGDDEIEVTLRFESWDAADGVADAKALAEYVEGTFVQGLIPGYDYVGAAADLRGEAAANAGSGADAAGGDAGDDADSESDRSGTPL
jgi:hypothetical protein